MCRFLQACLCMSGPPAHCWSAGRPHTTYLHCCVRLLAHITRQLIRPRRDVSTLFGITATLSTEGCCWADDCHAQQQGAGDAQPVFSVQQQPTQRGSSSSSSAKGDATANRNWKQQQQCGRRTNSHQKVEEQQGTDDAQPVLPT